MQNNMERRRARRHGRRKLPGTTSGIEGCPTAGADLRHLPIVDISPLYRADSRARGAAVGRLGAVAHEIGFLYITGYGIRERVIDRALAAARGFFSQPLRFKRGYYIGDAAKHCGYVPTTERGDYDDESTRRYEAFDLSVDRPATEFDLRAGNILAGPNRWPDVVGFRPAVRRCMDELLALAYLLVDALETYLGVPRGWFRDRMSRPMSQLRLIHYLRNTDTGDGGSNMGAHTDYECFTILKQFAPGLQALNAADRWIDVPPVPGTLVINIGDMLETWTGGHLRSTLHRVVNNGRERYSMPFFMATDFEAVIEPAPGFDSDCERHRPFVAGDHLVRMLMRDFPYLRRRRGARWRDGNGAPGLTNPFELRAHRSSCRPDAPVVGARCAESVETPASAGTI